MDARWEITPINSVHIEKKLSMIENIYFMSYFMSFFDFLIFIRSGIIQQERTNILDRLWNVRYVVQLQKPLHALLELVQLTSQLLPLLCQSITGNTHLTYFNILFQLYCIETYDNKNSNIQYKYCDFFFSPKINRNVKENFGCITLTQDFWNLLSVPGLWPSESFPYSQSHHNTGLYNYSSNITTSNILNY